MVKNVRNYDLANQIHMNLVLIVNISNACVSPYSSKMIDLLADWKHRLSFMGTDFQYIDLVLSMRVACIHSLLKKDELSQLPVREQLFSELHHILSTSAKLAREAGKYQVIF